MPHVNSGGGDDLASSDEVKIYKDEGDEEQRQSENLSEDKLGLVSESEEGKIRPDGENGKGSSNGIEGGKLPNHLVDGAFYKYSTLFNPYHYTPSAAIAGLTSQVFPPHPAALFPFYNDFTHPPPAHIGISPVPVDHKRGFSAPPLYPMPTLAGQFSPLYAPEFSQVPWPGSSGYSLSSGSPFVGPYGAPVPSSSPLARFSPGLFSSSAGGTHSSLLSLDGKTNSSLLDSHSHELKEQHLQEKRKPYIKKPLNAFMIFMKEMRQKVIEECTLKESAAINQILGRKWHGLSQSEQAKYYEIARQEKERHMKQFPGWSARDNYATHTKKKRKKREVCENAKDGNGGKKCRARFGLDKQSQWCHPCRRKKRCVRFFENGSITMGLGGGTDHELSDGEDDEDEDNDSETRSSCVNDDNIGQYVAVKSQHGSPMSAGPASQECVNSPSLRAGNEDLDLVNLWSPIRSFS